MTVELRCLTELHAKVDEALTHEVKCVSCTRKFGRPVFHHWTIEQMVEAHALNRKVIYPRIHRETDS